MNINYLSQIKETTFLLGVLTLPIHQKLNHWFFGCFMLVSIVLFFVEKKTFSNLKNYRFLILGIVSFFLLRILGLYNSISLDHGLKEVVRALPFLLYPLCIVSFKSQIVDNNKFERKVFYALVVGCVLTAIICWSDVLFSLKANDIAANKFFGWKKSGTYLTQLLNLHPPYLGLLFVASIVFLVKELFYNKIQILKYKYLIIFTSIFLLVFLFNITARNSLFYLILISYTFLILLKKWRLLLIPISLMFIAALVIYNHPSQYYRIKMYDMLWMSKKEEFKDKRFSRLDGSWEIFKTSPIIGVGSGNDQIFRNEKYLSNNDTIALNKKLNSHNQFFEYLVSLGLLGGLTFIFVNLYFVITLIKNKQYFYLILLGNILIATLTESIFERVLGIQYYAILISVSVLAISNNSIFKKNQLNFEDSKSI